jgi:hypothetical protein
MQKVFRWILFEIGKNYDFAYVTKEKSIYSLTYSFTEKESKKRIIDRVNI